MSERDSSAESDCRSVDLVEFVNENYTLLTVMGIFAAIAVYITQAAPRIGTTSDAELMAATGFVSALGMTLLFLSLVYQELASKTESWHNLYRAHFRFDNITLSLFTLFNVMLILSITSLILQYEAAIFIIVLVASFIVGFGVVHRIIYGVAKIVPHSPWIRIPMIFLASAVTLYFSNYTLVTYFSEYHIRTIHELSLSEPVPLAIAVVYILLASIRSGAAIGILASIIGVPIVIVDKIRGKSPYDNPD